MIAETAGDQGHHFGGDGIGGEPQRGCEAVAFRHGFAVFLIVIPLAAHRLITVHQQAGLPAHDAVEIFHDHAFAALRPASELFDGAQEAIIVEDGQRQARALGPRLLAVHDAPFATGHADDA